MKIGKFLTKNKEISVFTLLVLVSIVALAVSSSPQPVYVENVGLSIVGFFEQGFTTIGDFFSNTIDSVATLSDLKEEYDALLVKVEDFELLQSDIQALKDEIQRLQSVLEFQSEISVESIAANIIGKDPGILSTGFTIGKGSAHGIEKNMPVIAIQNGEQALLGRILQVGLTTSIVEPIYSPSFSVTGRLSSSRYDGLVSGRGLNDDFLDLSYIDRQSKNNISVGEQVITSGLSTIYPSDIKIGVVHSVTANPFENTVEIEVEPSLDFGNIEFVYVLAAKEEE